MHGFFRAPRRRPRLLGLAVLTTAIAAAICVGATSKSSAATAPAGVVQGPTVVWDAAHDLSPPLREMAQGRIPPDADNPGDEEDEGPLAEGEGYSPDGALQTVMPPTTIPATGANFEGLSNQDNFNIFGFRVTPPDPNGDVGPNNYVEMINLVFAVYDKAGNKLLGPIDTGTLWSDFAVPDCTDPSGDPVVLYDRTTDRWLLSQFTTSGLNPDGSFNGLPFYNCVAISQTGDP